MAIDPQAARFETGHFMTDITTNQKDSCQDSLDHLLDRGLSNRLTVVVGPNPDERKQLLTEWLKQRRYQVLLVDCSTGEDDDCPGMIVDSFVEAGIVEHLPGDDACQDACKARLISLMNELATLPRDLIVLLQNYQPGETTNKMLSFMLEHLPNQVHIYICCEDVPSLNCIPRLRVRRQFQTIDTGCTSPG